VIMLESEPGFKFRLRPSSRESPQIREGDQSCISAWCIIDKSDQKVQLQIFFCCFRCS